MSFWKFCEKVSGFVGDKLVITYIQTCRLKWENNDTVQDAVKSIIHAVRADGKDNSS